MPFHTGEQGPCERGVCVRSAEGPWEPDTVEAVCAHELGVAGETRSCRRLGAAPRPHSFAHGAFTAACRRVGAGVAPAVHTRKLRHGEVM